MMQNALRSFSGLSLAALVLGGGCRAAPPLRPQVDAARAGDLRPIPTLSQTRQRRWVDSTLATLSLRERVGQMVMVWTLGDYTNTRDPTYAQLIRWIEA